MASFCASGNPPPTAAANTASDTFLNRKKKEIVEKSMALFQKNLDRCLDQCSDSVVAPGGGKGAPKQQPRVLGKRARSPEEPTDTTTTTATITPHPIKTTRKKRIKPSPPGPQFACPFCKHNPAKYRTVKTCCGPGWEDVHRVKEHVYRNHSSKNFCSRCLEYFDNEEKLKAHQRLEIPCKLEKNKTLDAITDSQEKQLRTRAKPGSSEEDKWREMYKIIFPKTTNPPSPYYDPVEDSVAVRAGTKQKSMFQSVEDCKEYLRVELPKVVKPMIARYVELLFQDFQEKVNQKTMEIVRDVETKMLRTFQFQEEQQQQNFQQEPLAPTPDSLVDHGQYQVYGGGGGVEETGTKIDQLFEGLRGDPTYVDMCGSLQYNVEDLMAERGFLVISFGWSCSFARILFSLSYYLMPRFSRSFFPRPFLFLVGHGFRHQLFSSHSFMHLYLEFCHDYLVFAIRVILPCLFSLLFSCLFSPDISASCKHDSINFWVIPNVSSNQHNFALHLFHFEFQFQLSTI
ncbi:hypothetical protein QBC38DRAFT_134884 [Podospora fimiseda]|uniref:C2H2-type domain-containing protein n=1 Tax=Podospora fimiseda TaxID=252190 RepID=A0AAN7BGH2_9PEZI|nr:hypothetical protein QBC38DRAFT_134884 [Podospora fimiseda]